MRKIPRLYKLAAINGQSIRALRRTIRPKLPDNILDFIGNNGKSGKGALHAVSIDLLNNIHKINKPSEFKSLVRQADDQIYLTPFSKNLRLLRFNTALLRNLPVFKKLLLNYVLRLNGVHPLRSKNSLVGGFIPLNNNHVALPLSSGKLQKIFSDLDLYDLVVSFLSAKLGKVKLLPRAHKDLERVPSRYFGFLKDPLFNLPFYERTKNNPNIMPVSQYNSNIGRIFNTRGHTFDGKLIKFGTDWTDQRGRYQNQYIIAQPLGYPYGLQLIGEDLSRFTKDLGKGLYYIPQSMHWSPLIKALLISPIHF